MVAILTTFREIGRLQQIYVVLARHGFGEVARRLGLGGKKGTSDAPPGADDGADASVDGPKSTKDAAKSPMAERARLVLMDLGPSFVKLGQIASTRSDLLPVDWIRELKKLQDEVSPLPFADIKSAVEASLQGSLESVYESFTEEPLAAASIGQVHRAILRHDEGAKEVVAKVQRPGARRVVARDLEILHHLAKLLERMVPESRTYSPCGLVEQFDRAITAELDYALEAENCERFRKNFEGHANVRFPMVYRSASSRELLTLEFLPGKKVYDAIEKDGFSREKIAKIAVGVVIKMVFEDGFFHADPHPGNILISGTPDDPVIGLVDLGMVGRLSAEMRDRCIDLMIAAVRKDPIAIADAIYGIGLPTKKVEMRAYRAEVARLADKYLGKPLKDIEFSALITDLMRGAQQFGIEIPPDFLLVGKALMTVEGVGKEIYPDLDILEESKPYFLDLLKRRYSPEKIGGDILRGIERVGSSAYDLPQIAREVLEDVRMGRLTVSSADPGLPASMDRLGRRIWSSVVTAAFVGSGAGLVAADHLHVGIGLLSFGILVMLGHAALDLVKRWK
jgi:ubiquinone biosynthesis protein